MIMMVGKRKLIETAEIFFSELKEEGLEPDTRVYTEMIGAYLQVGMTEKAMETYGLMKVSGCVPDELTLTILIRNLEKAGEEELAKRVKKESEEYVDSPRKFLAEVEKKYVRTLIFILFHFPFVLDCLQDFNGLFGYPFLKLFYVLKNEENKENKKNTFSSMFFTGLKNAENIKNTKL